jgi:hypothetical protein
MRQALRLATARMRAAPEEERRFWSAAEKLNRIAAIIANNERWHDVAAQVAEHRPELDEHAAQLEVKRILIREDARGGPEQAGWFMRSLGR